MRKGLFIDFNFVCFQYQHLSYFVKTLWAMLINVDLPSTIIEENIKFSASFHLLAIGCSNLSTKKQNRGICPDDQKIIGIACFIKNTRVK